MLPSPLQPPLPHGRLVNPPLCLFFLNSISINLLTTDSCANKDDLHSCKGSRCREAVNSPWIGDQCEHDAEEKAKGYY